MPINSESLAKIGVRLMVIYFAFELIKDIPTMAAYGYSWKTLASGMEGMYWLPLIGLILLSFLLWIYAGLLGKVMVGRLQPSSDKSEEDLPGMIISIMGLYLVISSMPILLSQAWALYNYSAIIKNVGGDTRIYQSDILSGLVIICLQIVLGLMLLTTSSFWVKVLKNIREYGLKG